MTVLDLIKRAMRLIGALNVGEEPTADEQQDALTALNALVDAWGTRPSMRYTTARNVYNLTPGQPVYEIGPSATGTNWTAPRPVAIDYAGLILANSDPTLACEEPLHIIKTEAEFARIRAKSLPSTLPDKLWYDRWFSNPNPLSRTQTDVGSANVYLYPCPTVANQVALYTPWAVGQLTALTQLIAMPPGYGRALAYNLAIEFAPEFETEPSSVVVAIAQESLADLARANYRPRKLRADRSLAPAGRRRGFDYRTGEEA